LLELDDVNGIVNRSTHQNTGSHVGGRGFTHDNVLSLKPDAVIVGGMGPRGLTSFQSQGVAVLQANSSSVDEIVVAYVAGRLRQLTEGCHDAHHK
jgi:predicted Fe-Mo cluster-binding NifX family protein